MVGEARQQPQDSAIAVLGGGNGGQCMAADLALAGHRVVLCELREFAGGLGEVPDTRRLELVGAGRTGTAELAAVTFDVSRAVADARLINLVVPAFGHERFFQALLPCLRDGQSVVVWAGDFGSLELRRLLGERRPELDVVVVETSTLPYGTRLEAPGRVSLPLLASRVLAAAVPASAGKGTIAQLRGLWPCLEPAEDVLSVALSNPNPVVHPPGSLLNVGWIEHAAEGFHMYGTGITEAVARVIRAVQAEVQAVAGALGARVPVYDEEDFRTRASIMGVAFRAPFDTVGAIGSIAGPTSIEDRYITEDLPYGLVPVAELGDAAGVETPLIDSLVTLGSAVCGRDFRAEGRGLERLGLAGLGPGEIGEWARHGRVGAEAG